MKIDQKSQTVHFSMSQYFGISRPLEASPKLAVSAGLVLAPGGVKSFALLYVLESSGSVYNFRVWGFLLVFYGCHILLAAAFGVLKQYLIE